MEGNERKDWGLEFLGLQATIVRCVEGQHSINRRLSQLEAKLEYAESRSDGEKISWLKQNDNKMEEKLQQLEGVITDRMASKVSKMIEVATEKEVQDLKQRIMVLEAQVAGHKGGVTTGLDPKEETGASAVPLGDADVGNVDVSGVCGNDEAVNEEVSNLSVENVTLFEFVVFKVASAKSGTLAQAMNACMWILLALSVALAEAICIISIAIGVAWSKCSSSDDCKRGMACVSIEEEGTQLPATCEDCYFLSDNLGAISDNLYHHAVIEEGIPGGIGMVTQNATNVCLEQLSMTLFHFEDGQTQDFSKCLYVRSAKGLMSPQDHIVLLITFALVALAMAVELKEESRVRLLVSACLPIQMPGRNAASVGIFLAVILLKFTAVVLRYIVLPLLPPTLILLLLAEGASSVSILLNGLSVLFVIEIDDCIPGVLLSQLDIAEAEDFLSDVARKHPPFRGSIRNQTFVSYAYAVCCFMVLLKGFHDVSGFNCEQVIHFVYYRVGVSYGIWCAALLQATVICLEQLSAALYQWPDLWQQYQLKTSFAKLVNAVSVLLSIISFFLEPLFGAFLVNLLYWYQSNVLFYDSTLEDSYEIWFDVFVLDLFGACGAGFADSCL